MDTTANIAKTDEVGFDMTTTNIQVRSYRVRRGIGIDGLELATHARPALGPGDVRVRMRAVALNYRDLMIARGDSGIPDRTVVAGSDGAGEVIEVGAQVTQFRIGDRVMTSFFPDWLDGAPTPAVLIRALGGSAEGVLAEEVVLDQNAWVAMPAHMDFVEAATIPCAGVTAWNALFCAVPLAPGATVLLLGTGGVSMWALQLAKRAGMRVIVTSSDDRKLERARALGADATINYRTIPDWESEALRLSDGRGVDRVLEVGGPDTMSRSIASVRMGGSVVIIGRLTGTDKAAFDPVAVFNGFKHLTGVNVGSRAMSADLARFTELGAIHPVIDKTFDFAHARDAYAYLATAQHFGKVVITI
jgi:NADPH:quinone reductase-like Zn-dependent oxidoreductase